MHVTDASNAAVTGLAKVANPGEWDPAILDALRIPERVLPAIVDSDAAVGAATALPGAPPITRDAGRSAGVAARPALRSGR